MRLFGMCFNWKVVAGLAVVALGVWAFAPQALVVALPLLLLAACPLSMLFMMRSMDAMDSAGSGARMAARTETSMEGRAGGVARSPLGMRPDETGDTAEVLRQRLERAYAEQDELLRGLAALRERESVNECHAAEAERAQLV